MMHTEQCGLPVLSIAGNPKKPRKPQTKTIDLCQHAATREHHRWQVKNPMKRSELKKHLHGTIKYVRNINGFLDETDHLAYGDGETVFLCIKGTGYKKSKNLTRKDCESLVRSKIWRYIAPSTKKKT
jgi:hypothetical protein